MGATEAVLRFTVQTEKCRKVDTTMLANPLIERLGWTLVHFLWQGVCVAAMLVIALAFTRRSRPSVRYGLACAAMASMALFPALTFFSLAPEASAPFTPVKATVDWLAGGAIVAQAAQGRDPMMWVVFLWTLGVAVFSARLIGGLLQTERWRRRHTQPVGPEWEARAATLAERFGIAQKVSVLLSTHIEVPSAWGVLRPVIVLPAALMVGMTPIQVEAILLHELAHIRRRDYLVNLLQSVLETVLFYHPAVWWVSSVVRREREHCCDDAVIAALGDPMPYARALLQLEERRLTIPRPALSAKESHLMNRIARILGAKPAPSRFASVAPALAAIAVLGTLMGGAIQAQAQSTGKTAPKPVKTVKGKKVAPKSSTGSLELDRARQSLLVAERALLEAKKNQSKAMAARSNLAKAQSELVRTQEAFLQAQAQARVDILRKQLAFQFAKGQPTKIAVATVKGAPTKAAIAEVAAVSAPRAMIGGPVSETTLPDATPWNYPAGRGGAGIKIEGGLVDVDVHQASFDELVLSIARKAGITVTIQAGAYLPVTLVTKGQSPNHAIELLCMAAGATYRIRKTDAGEQTVEETFITSSFVGNSGGGIGGGS